MFNYELKFVLYDNKKQDNINFFQNASEIRLAEREYNARFENVQRAKRINVIIQSNFLRIFLMSQNEIDKKYAPCCLQYFSQTLVENHGFAHFCIGDTRRLFTSIKP